MCTTRPPLGSWQRDRQCGDRSRRHGAPAPWDKGFTLVEVLIVIALIAVVTAVAVGGSGMLGNSRLRSAATMVLSAIRTATTRANTIGRPVRIVFDFEERRVVLEEARGRMLRDREDETGAVGAEPATEAEREAKEYANEVLEGPRAPKPQFSAIGEFGDESGDGPGRELGSGIV